LKPAEIKPGRRVLIDRVSLRVRSPRRWEVVVVRHGQDPQRLAVKRVVGLPGEHVRIHRGDIYINQRIVRKSMSEQRRMLLPVHDGRYRPPNKCILPARWRPDVRPSDWQVKAGRFLFAPTGALNHQDSAAVGTSPHGPGRFDWLVYHHWSGLPPPTGRTVETPVRDNDPYNAGLSRRLLDVTDLALTTQVRLAGTGELAVLAHDGRQWLEIQWHTNSRRLRLLEGGIPVAEGVGPDAVEGRHILLEVMLCDGQLQLALDGQQVLAYMYAAEGLPVRPTSRPLAIGAVGLQVEISELRVWRDVYYNHPFGVPDDWSLERPLGPDEYLLLGDNSPISVDGRHSAPNGRLPRRAIVGRVLPVPAPRYPTRRVGAI
jgi:signal peptidase I